MGAWDWLKDKWGNLSRNANAKSGATELPYFERDRMRLNQLMRYGEYDPRWDSFEKVPFEGYEWSPGANGGIAGGARPGGGAGGGGGGGGGYGPYLGQDQYRGQVDENLARQLAMARGEGPSLADQQFRAATQSNISAQKGMAAGGRGAQGARFAAQNIARTQAGMAQGAAEARTREQMAAQGAYNQSLQQAQGAATGREAMNQSAYLDMLGKQLGLSSEELKARMGNAQLPANYERLMNVWGSILPMMASDERAKTDIRDGGEGVDEFLGQLRAQSYRYRPDHPLQKHTGGIGDGRRVVGIMAQDLEKSELGRAIVHDTPDGKTVDVVGGLSASLAAAARLNERVSALESGLPPKPGARKRT